MYSIVIGVKTYPYFCRKGTAIFEDPLIQVKIEAQPNVNEFLEFTAENDLMHVIPTTANHSEDKKNTKRVPNRYSLRENRVTRSSI